jgi:phosphoglycolate phosphatase
MLKLLIFDLDGTLTDTAQDIADAINYALKPFGQKNYSVEETKTMVGSGISKLLESLLPATHPIPPLLRGGEGGVIREPSAKEIVINRFLEYYSEHLLDNTRAYPYVKETLSKLGNYKKAVVSNKRESFSKSILEGIGILKFFDIVFGSDSVPEKKPSPVPILKLLERFHVTCYEAVIIGDSNYDIEAGKAGGIKTIAVAYGFRSREVLKDADFIIDSFDELLNIIPQISPSP